MASIKKNLGYQTIYQILNIGFPLITAPFLARVLGAESLGIMSYTSSIVHFFTLFAMMGLANYGTRSIALVKDELEKRNSVFSQIFYMQLITTSIAFIAYGIYMFYFCKDNILISWIQCIAIIACFFDINWFFFGIEEFKLTVIRGMIIRVLSVLLMLLLIRSAADLWIYAVLLIGSTFLNQIVLWLYVPKFVSLKKQEFCKIKKHFIPNVKLFIPLLAMSVYHIMDKTMLGFLSNYTQSGYYYNADKVINIPVGLLIGFITVLFPRMSILVGNDEKRKFETLFNTVTSSICLVSAAMCCGIAAIANEFTPVFFGSGYDECIILIIYLAPVLFIKGFSFIFRYLYLIPNQLENDFTASVIIGAVVNFVVNLILIPKWGAIGAVIGTLAAELAACLWQYKIVIAKVNCGKSLFTGLIYFAIGVLMFIGVRFVSSHITMALFPKILIEVLVGVLLYSLLCLLYWCITGNKTELNLIKLLITKTETKS